MSRIGLGQSVLALLFMTYWFNPTLAWVILGTAFAVVMANRTRQHDATCKA